MSDELAISSSCGCSPSPRFQLLQLPLLSSPTRSPADADFAIGPGVAEGPFAPCHLPGCRGAGEEAVLTSANARILLADTDVGIVGDVGMFSFETDLGMLALELAAALMIVEAACPPSW